MSCSSSCDGCWNGLKDCATLLLELVDRSASDGLKHDTDHTHTALDELAVVSLWYSALDKLAVMSLWYSALDKLAVMSLLYSALD